MDARENDAKRLRQEVEWSLRSALDPGEVLPLLHRLVRTAEAGSDDSVFAHRQLAELLVERHPWRAALHARRVLANVSDDDRAWAVLGLCQTLLGNYRFAATAYHHALSASPKNPWYAHNLGHLLDVALGRVDESVTWLRTAYDGAMGNREIAASFAHALARAGKLAEAKRVLSKAMKRGVSREQAALMRWLEAGAPPAGDASGHLGDLADGGMAGPDAADGVAPTGRRARGRTRARRQRRSGAASSSGAVEALAADDAPVQSETRTEGAAALEQALLRGLENLPLDTRQRARARALSRDPVARTLAEAGHNVQSLAAAIAYAIVYIDHVPLTQAEVAASFRVGVASLRGRFSALRTQLHLAPGDARYRTKRS